MNSRIHIILGTKAQLIKMGPVLKLLQARGIHYNYVTTGQHLETVDDLRANFGIKTPDKILVAPSDVTSIAHMLRWAVRVLWNGVTKRKEIFGSDTKGAFFIVHGDTLSALLGALLGRLLGGTVCHVEAGLRSFNLLSPFPEELTRILTFQLAHVYFCPGDWALSNLSRFRGTKISTSENTLRDAVELARTGNAPQLTNLPERYAVCTLHRFENIFRQDGLRRLVDQVERISQVVPLVFILHPPTLSQLKKHGLLSRLEQLKSVQLRPRLDFFSFIALIAKAEFVVSDGGSNQEECSYLGIPCLLLRSATERREGLGKNVVLSEHREDVINDFLRRYSEMRTPIRAPAKSPSEIIVDYLSAQLK